MRRKTTEKLISVLVAVILFLSCPISGDAFLTELIVGGGIIAEVGGTIISALPQLTLFVSSVITLAKTSNEIADTVMGIIKFFMPSSSSHSSSGSTGSGSTGSTGSATDGSVQQAPGDSSDTVSSQSTGESDTSDSSESDEANDEILAMVTVLVEKFPLEMELVKQISALPEDSPQREALGEAYGEIISLTVEIRETLTTRILDAVKNGDSKTVDHFAEIAQGLEGQGRVAVAPVLSRIIEQGAAFNKLYSLPDEGLLATLTDIYGSYLQ